MNVKKSLEKRIRGWLPSTPTMPQPQRTLPKFQNNLANPLPPVLENKFQRGAGILIGFGIGLFAIGLVGALFANQTYSEVQTFLSYQGVGTDNYLFRDMVQQTALYLALAVGGVFLGVLGALSLRSQIFRKVSAPQSRNQYFLGNFLFGFGTGLMVLSFRSLFIYLLATNDLILNHDYFQLELFTGVFVVGACLFAAGIMSWRRTR